MSQNKSYKTLRLILGDQLNRQHSWYTEKNEGVCYLLAELKQEARYVKHHIQKITAFFASMREFAQELKNSGHHVEYLTLDETKNYDDLSLLLNDKTIQYSVKKFEYQRPDEFRLAAQLENLTLDGVTIQRVESEHFLLDFSTFTDFVSPGKHNRMEFFYRKMRVKTGYLMNDNNTPEGGKWNYDANNRGMFKQKDIDNLPQTHVFANDVSAELDRVKRHAISTFGNTETTLPWPINRLQSLTLLHDFCDTFLIHFGTFQDAMTANSQHAWSLYHSRLSFSLNTKMLSPKEVIETAISKYRQFKNDIDLSQIEGFVRQIIGWREYIRAVYWLNMPDYAQKNHFDAQRSLPSFYWDAKTKMNCMRNAIQQSLDYSYAHHIQRLMITGNFALLTDLNPDEVDSWYLGIYIDAIEWVEMPNTRGMSLFADGGLVATKPYSAGGNYINKMSDYCKSCSYKVKEKTGSTACPFNSLYWGFMVKHREELEKNPRIGMVYKNWDKQDPDIQKLTLEKADWIKKNINQL